MPRYIIQKEIRYELAKDDSGTSEPLLVKEKILQSRPLDFSNNVSEGETLRFPNYKEEKVKRVIHTQTCSVLELEVLSHKYLTSKEKIIEEFEEACEENSFIERL